MMKAGRRPRRLIRGQGDLQMLLRGLSILTIGFFSRGCESSRSLTPCFFTVIFFLALKHLNSSCSPVGQSLDTLMKNLF
jgi:hypothetical protein